MYMNESTKSSHFMGEQKYCEKGKTKMERIEEIRSIVDKLKAKQKAGQKLTGDEILAAFKDLELTDAESEDIFRIFSAVFGSEEEVVDEKDLIIDTKVNVKDVDSFRLFLNTIGNTPLLTAEEEIELSKTVKKGLKAKEKNEEIKKRLEDPNTEPKTLSNLRSQMTKNNKLIEEGKIASNEMVTKNLRLVVSIAKHYVGISMTIEDMVQEGSIGLKRATESFDHTKGYRFSTYATWWIKQSITRAIAQQDRMIRLPVHVVDNVNRVRKVQQKLAIRFGREATVKEIAEELQMEVSQVEDIIHNMFEPTSLSTPIGEDGDTSLSDLIVDENGENPADVVINNQMFATIAKVLDMLTDREKDVIIRRFGLFGVDRQSLEQVGAHYHLTRERIRQIESKAIRKLRHKSVSLQLKDFIYDSNGMR